MSSPTLSLRIVIPDGGSLEEILSFQDGGDDGANEVISDDGNSGDQEAATEQALLDTLSERDIDTLARVSYAFWAWERLYAAERSLSSAAAAADDVIFQKRRSRSARREIRRFCVAEHHDNDKSLHRIRAAIQWRQDEQIDLLRLCFAATVAEAAAASGGTTCSTIVEVPVSEAEHETIRQFETSIRAELRIQKMVVRGCDRQKRAIIIKLSRQGPWPTSDHDAARRSYEIAHCYFAERGLATSEYLTRGTLHEVMVVADFGDYDSAHSPPVGVIMAGLLGLQPHYPERLGKAVLLDAPLWLHGIVTLLKPLLSESTRSRLIVSGGTLDALTSYFYGAGKTKSITEIIHELVDESQAMPFLLPGGQLSSDMDPIAQVTTVPFFCLYDHGLR